jgi:hypothetical protein
MRNQYHFLRPPGTLHQAQLDNLALVPGSLLPYKTEWQALANRLPTGAILIVLSADNPSQKQSLLAVAKLLAREGHQVRVVPAEEVMRPPAYEQSPLDLE